MKSLVLRRLIAWYRPHRSALLGATVLMAIGAACQGGLVFLIETVLDDVLIRRDKALLAWIPLAVAGLYGVKGLVRVGSGLLVHRAGLRAVRDLRERLFGHLLELGPHWHGSAPAEERISLLVQDVGRTESLVHGLAQGVEKPLTLMALLLAAWFMDWQLTLAAMVVLPLVALAIHGFSKRLRSSFRQSLDNLGRLGAISGQSLVGISVVQAFNAQASRSAHFAMENREQERLQLRSRLARIIPGPVIEALAAVGVGLVIATGGLRVMSGALQPGELMAFLVAIGLMNMPLKGLSAMAADLQEAAAAADRIFETLDRVPAVVGGEEQSLPIDWSLSFEDVWVSPEGESILRGVDLKVEPGETVALVGASGCGKTTLASLVPRLMDPCRGVVRIGDHDIRVFSLEVLRSCVAYVPQHPVLFEISVRDNLCLGRPGASDEEVWEACRRAGAEDFVKALPCGLDTVLLGAGGRLSGGERQRLCIARALLVDAPILLLDEATSSLEPNAEARVQAALAELSQDRTTLAIAHRLSTVQAADRIVVLEGGRIVDSGRHEDLLLDSPSYRRFLGASQEIHS